MTEVLEALNDDEGPPIGPLGLPLSKRGRLAGGKRCALAALGLLVIGWCDVG